MRIKSILSKNKPLIITVGFACLSLVLWIVTATEVRIADFFLNLFACFTASAITVGIVDRISRRREEEQLVPIRQAIYRDIQLFCVRVIYLWQEMYIQSQEDRSEITVEQLFSSEIISKIYSSLDLEGEPSILPKRTWFMYIDECSGEMKVMSESILDRYSFFLPPVLMQAIHYTLTDCVFTHGRLKVVSSLLAMDKRYNIPRPPTLISYLGSPQEKDFEAVHQLLNWCQQEYAYLSSKGAIVYPLVSNVTILNPHIPPSSIIDEGKLTEYEQAYEAWSHSSPKFEE